MKHRLTSPSFLNPLWDAVAECQDESGPLGAKVAAISTLLHRSQGLDRKYIDEQIKNAIEDGMVSVRTDHLYVPELQKETKASHDWYCYRCHEAGDVINCVECWRVYHYRCVRPAEYEDEEDEEEEDKQEFIDNFVCDCCKKLAAAVELDSTESGKTQSEINSKLAALIQELNEKAVDLFEFPIISNTEQWRCDRLVYEKVDLHTIDLRTKRDEYGKFEQFEVDVCDAAHTFAVFYGSKTQIGKLAAEISNHCVNAIKLMTRCLSCYLNSTKRFEEPDWFCKVCEPPHQLVYAKPKDSFFRPAKVLRTLEEGTKFEVLYFQSYKQDIVDLGAVRPIASSTRKVGLNFRLKTHPDIAEAVEELKRYQTRNQQSFVDSNNSLVITLDDDFNSKKSKSKSPKRKRRRKSGSQVDRKFRPVYIKSEPIEVFIDADQSKPPFESIAERRKKLKRMSVKEEYSDSIQQIRFDSYFTIPVRRSRRARIKVEPKSERERSNTRKSSQTKQSSQNQFNDNLSMAGMAGYSSSGKKLGRPRKRPDENGQFQSNYSLKQKRNEFSSNSFGGQSPQSPFMQSTPKNARMSNWTPSTSRFNNGDCGRGFQSNYQNYQRSFFNANSPNHSCYCKEEIMQNLLLQKNRMNLSYQRQLDALQNEIKNLEKEKQFLYSERQQLQEKLTQLRMAVRNGCDQSCHQRFAQLKRRYEEQLNEVKRRLWCVVCLQPAAFYCCRKAFYCGRDCQVQDWNRSHKKVCKLASLSVSTKLND